MSVRDTLNYQNNCRNIATFGWLVNLSYKVAKLNIHLCVDDGRFPKFGHIAMNVRVVNDRSGSKEVTLSGDQLEELAHSALLLQHHRLLQHSGIYNNCKGGDLSTYILR